MNFLVPRVIIFLLMYLLLMLGCGGNQGPTPKSVSPSPAQHFREHQGSTVTPHGKIRIGTVEEKDGKIQYQTEDGRKWRVPYTRRADDTYQYGTPEEVK